MAGGAYELSPTLNLWCLLDKIGHYYRRCMSQQECQIHHFSSAARPLRFVGSFRGTAHSF